jgi:hypothetical protein
MAIIHLHSSSDVLYVILTSGTTRIQQLTEEREGRGKRKSEGGMGRKGRILLWERTTQAIFPTLLSISLHFSINLCLSLRCHTVPRTH